MGCHFHCPVEAGRGAIAAGGTLGILIPPSMILEMVIETVEIKNQITGESLQTEKEFLLKMNLKRDSRLLSISS